MDPIPIEFCRVHIDAMRDLEHRTRKLEERIHVELTTISLTLQKISERQEEQEPMLRAVSEVMAAGRVVRWGVATVAAIFALGATYLSIHGAIREWWQ